MAAQAVVCPGQRLVKGDEACVSGPGTYARAGTIFSSMLGIVSIGRHDGMVGPVVAFTGNCQLAPPALPGGCNERDIV